MRPRTLIMAPVAAALALVTSLLGGVAPAQAVGECPTGWTFTLASLTCTKSFTSGTTTWTPPAGVGSVEYLVAGGGGGGQPYSGSKGGSGGQVQQGTVVPSGTVTVTVGAGGAANANGAASSISGGMTATATGGTGGGRTGSTGTTSSISGTSTTYGADGANGADNVVSAAGPANTGKGGGGGYRRFEGDGCFWDLAPGKGSIIPGSDNCAGGMPGQQSHRWTGAWTTYAGAAGGSGIVVLRYSVFGALSFTTAVSSPTNTTNPIDYTLTFNESADLATLSGADISNAGSATSCVFTTSPGLGTATSATVTATGCSDGTLIPTLGASTVTSASAKTGPTSSYAGTTLTLDRVAPTVNTPTIATAGGTVVANTATATNTTLTLTATITAGQATGGHADFYLDNTLIGTDASIAAGDTSVTLAYASNAAIQAGLPNSGNITVKLYDTASNVATSGIRIFTADYVVPTVTSFAPAGGQAAIVSTLPITFTLVMNTSVSGLAAADFTQTGTSASCTFTPSAASGTTFTVTATGCTTGTVLPRLNNATVTAVNNTGPSAVSPSSSAVTYVTSAPLVSGYPVISATTGSITTINSNLSSTMGSWVDGGDTSASSAIRWWSCPSTPYNAGTCTAITGATSATFTPDSTYVGKYLYTVVTRTNVKGSTTATSANYAGPLAKLSQTITFGTLAARTYSPTPFALTGTASSGLTVSYSSSDTNICTVSSNMVTMVAAGTCTITAAQTGNSTYLAAATVARGFVISKASQTITLVPGTSSLDSPRTYTLTSTASGTGARTYTVTSGATYCSITGAVLTTSGTGSCTVTVAIAADGAYFGATSSAATYTISALPGPVTVADAVAMEMDSTAGIAVLGNDTPNGTFDLTTVQLCSSGSCTGSSVTVPTKGTFSIGADGTIAFAPVSGFTGTVSTVGYRVKNTTAVAWSNQSLITVTVLPPPAVTAADDAQSGGYGSPIVFTPYSNDSPGTVPGTGYTTTDTVALVHSSVRLCTASDATLPCTGTSLATVDGTYTVNVATGDVTFAPASGFHGTATVPVSYSITNTLGAGWSPMPSVSTGRATLTPTVSAAASPTTVNDSAVTVMDTDFTIAPLDNDSAGAGSIDASTLVLCDPSAVTTPCALTTVSVPGEGTYIAHGDGTVDFTPEQGYVGTATGIPYQVKNTASTAYSSSATIAITVVAPPVTAAVDDAQSGSYGSVVTFHPAANDSPGTTPIAGYTASGTLSLDASGIRLCATAADTPPCALTSTSTVDGDYQVLVNGDVEFTPAPGFSGTATVPVAYSIANVIGVGWSPIPVSSSDTALLTATVGAPADPTAVADTDTGAIDSDLLVSPLANDSAGAGTLLGSSLRLCDPSAVTSPCAQTSVHVTGEGTFTANANGTVGFHPDPGFHGSVTAVPYQVRNSASATYSNRVTISVSVLEGLTFQASDDTAQGSSGSSVAFHPEANDTSITVPASYGAHGSVAADPATVRLCDVGQAPSNCAATSLATVDGNYSVDTQTGVVTFAPASGFVGTVTAPPTYMVCTATSGSWSPTPPSACSTGTLTADVSASAVAPVAVDDSSSAAMGITQTIHPLANDTENGTYTTGSLLLCDSYSAATCTETSLSVTGQGDFTVAGRSVTFVPSSGFSGSVIAVAYQVSNATGASNKATLHVSVLGMAAPSAGGLSGRSPYNTPVVFDPVAAGSPGSTPNGYATPGTLAMDPASVRLCGPLETPPTCTQVSQSTSDGTYRVDASTGQITFTPAAGFSGTTSNAPSYVICNVASGGWTPVTPASECTFNVMSATIDEPPPPPAPLWTLSFQANGGSCTPSQVQAYDTAWVATPGAGACTRDGYRFIGWNTSPTGGGIGFTPGAQTQMSGDNTLYAQWESTAVPAPAPTPTPAPRPTPQPPAVTPVGPHLVPQDGTVVDGLGTVDPLKDATTEPGRAIDKSSVKIWDGSSWVPSFTEPGIGTWEVVDGQIRFTPVPGFYGSADIRFQVADSTGATSTGDITFTVPAPAGDGGNRGSNGSGVIPPPGAPSVDPGGPSLVPQEGVIGDGGSGTIDPLEGATTPGGDPIDLSSIRIWDGAEWVTSYTDPGVGTWEVVDGEIRFTPVPGYTGTAETSFEVADSKGRTSYGRIRFTVPGATPAGDSTGAGGAGAGDSSGGSSSGGSPSGGPDSDATGSDGTSIVIDRPSGDQLQRGSFRLDASSSLEAVSDADFVPALAFESSTPSVCTVDARGRVTMVAPGFCTIVVTQPEAIVGGRTIAATSLAITMHLGPEASTRESVIYNPSWVRLGSTSHAHPLTSLSQLEGTRIVSPVIFGPDSAELTAEARSTLREAARYVRHHGGLLYVSGFVRNGGGDPAYQRDLSRDRALVAGDALSSLVPGHVFICHGYGSIWAAPGSPNDRRVEIRWVAAAEG